MNRNSATANPNKIFTRGSGSMRRKSSFAARRTSVSPALSASFLPSSRTSA
jgi:hypothetical protein